MPNITVIAPKNTWELEEMLKFALSQDAPVAVRYPRGRAYQGFSEYTEPIVQGKSEWICHGENIALLAVGSMVETAVEEGTWCSLLAYMCVCSCVRVHECTHTYTHARTHTHTHTHTHTQISTPHTHICEHLAYFLQGTE